MKEWLADKKNVPIIAAGASVIIIGVVVFLLFQFGVLGGSSSSAVVTNVPVPTGPPGAPGGPGAPVGMPPALGMAPGGLGAPRTAGAPAKGGKVILAKAGARPDPFLPFFDPKKLTPPPPPVSQIVTIGSLGTYLPPLPGGTTAASAASQTAANPATPDVPLGRISGIIFSNGVHALYEANGSTYIVQPGDELPGGGGRVEDIEGTGITVRVAGNRTVQVPVTAGSGTDNSGNTGGGPPGGMPGLPGQGAGV